MAEPITERDVVKAVHAHERLMGDADRMYQLSRDLGGATSLVVRRYGGSDRELKIEEVRDMATIANKYAGELQRSADDVLREVMPPAPSLEVKRSPFRELIGVWVAVFRG